MNPHHPQGRGLHDDTRSTETPPVDFSLPDHGTDPGAGAARAGKALSKPARVSENLSTDSVRGYWCPGCRRALPADAFYRSPRTWYGLRCRCKQCELASKRRPPLPRRACGVCGDEYQPVRVDQRWCSTRCRNRRERAPRVRGVRNCDQCGTEFAWHPKTAMRFCSRRCWARWRVAHGTKPPGRQTSA
jgi:hypothetical protein